MFQTLVTAFKTKEIRIKIWMTLLMLFVFKLGCYIPVPGLNVSVIESAVQGSDFLGMLSTLSGGAMQNGTLFALGILPFINAFIIMQLLSLAIPALERMTKDGDEGRRKITQITRIVALVLAVVQAVGIVISWHNIPSGSAIQPLFAFEAGQTPYLTMTLIITILVAGSVMVMWLGERMTEYGIGNGTSLIIFVGILSTAAISIAKGFKLAGNGQWELLWNIFGYLLIIALIFVFIVFMDGAERRVTVQYSKQIKGNKMYGGQSSFIPVRITAGGVMPIIFASSLIMFPQMIMQLFWPNSPAYGWYSQNMGSGTWPYYVFLSLFILFFSYFYAMIQFNPDEVAKNIKQYGGFLPGIRPGKPTSQYLARINNRITFFGAIFLAIIALVPTFIFQALSKNNGLAFGSAFSATGLLIVVSVALELNKQLEAQIMMKHYNKGFLK